MTVSPTVMMVSDPAATLDPYYECPACGERRVAGDPAGNRPCADCGAEMQNIAVPRHC